MDINQYVQECEIGCQGIKLTLLDGSKHSLYDELSSLALARYISENIIKSNTYKKFEGLLGGDYGNIGFYITKGAKMFPDVKLEDLLQDYKGKTVRITVEEV